MDNPPSINVMIGTLPVAIVKEIFSFVGSIRQQRIVMTQFGKGTWSMLPELERSIRTLQISDENDANVILSHHIAVEMIDRSPFPLSVDLFQQRNLQHIFLRLENLQNLNLYHYANDTFFEFLHKHSPLPNLQSLSMEGSMHVTDTGLRQMAASSGEARRQNFQFLNVTFCRNTTYAATIFLREKLPNLKLIRRQPEWLDGQFFTPFAADGAPTEVHTYWPDGTFTFSRNSQSAGFVCDLFPWDPSRLDFVGDKLQYNNFEFPVGWPEWFRFAYRPGVSLLRLDEELEDPQDPNSLARCVLVGQHMRGLRPPNIRELMESVSGMLKIGQGKQFSHNGQLLQDDLPADGSRDCIMISKMKVNPLSNDNMLPPPNLLQECKNTCHAMAAYGDEFLRQKEDDLQNALTTNR